MVIPLITVVPRGVPHSTGCTYVVQVHYFTENLPCQQKTAAFLRFSVTKGAKKMRISAEAARQA
jgi:hypothetical protein